jgi:SAM-dependent methyltransferase
MSEGAYAKWEARYRAVDYTPDLEPVPFLREQIELFSPTDALCLAAGCGRNAVFLAERGFAVRAVDISPRGLDWCRALAQERNVEVETVAADLLNYDLGAEQYGLVIDFYYYEKSIFPAIKRALKPGGHFVFQTFSVDQATRPTGPSNRAFMVEPDALLAEFSDWRIRYFEDRVVDDEALVRMIAQKRA